jgi:hypothetical protein
MSSEMVELHLPGACGTTASTAAEPPARLEPRGYTFTTAGGAAR